MKEKGVRMGMVVDYVGYYLFIKKVEGCRVEGCFKVSQRNHRKNLKKYSFWFFLQNIGIYL
jgi:hypothetical protein